MENASKAMIIVAGALLGIMILSLGVILFDEMKAYVQATNDRIDSNALNAFNTQFTNFMNKDLKIQDVVTAANLAYEINVEYDMSSFIEVYLDGNRIDNGMPEAAVELLSDFYKQRKTYKCLVEYNQTTGKVNKVHFSTK